jgi:hypothetical protein
VKPLKKIAALAACTVIVKNDLAATLLDSAQSPAWQGETYKLVYEWPTRADLWEEYLKIRAEGFLPGGDRGEAATAYYAERRVDMDAGSRVAWPARHGRGELSALQYAFNLRQDLREEAFSAEYQNDP